MNVQDTRSAAPRLVRSLTLTHALLYGLGVTIGAGIYVLTGIAAARSGLHAPLAFLGAALVMAFSAASFAELGTRMPVSASEAAYVQAAFGRKWLSLGVGLLVVASSIVSAAAISVGSAGYFGVILNIPAPWIILGVVVTMGIIACLPTVHSVTFAGVLTLIEVGGLLLIVGSGLAQSGEVFTRLPEVWPSTTSPNAWFGIAGTALIAVFAFIGFEHLVNVAEEMKQPNRTLPLALFLTLGITALLYALVVWISVIAVPPQELALSSAPLALVFERLTGLPLWIMSAIAIVATLNGIIVHMIMIARVIYGLAQQGNLPGAFKRVNPATRTPLLATAVGVGVILILALAVPLTGLADLTARLTLVIFAIINLALIRIKHRKIEPIAGAFVCPTWVPYAGLTSSVMFLMLDFVG